MISASICTLHFMYAFMYAHNGETSENNDNKETQGRPTKKNGNQWKGSKILKNNENQQEGKYLTK